MHLCSFLVTWWLADVQSKYHDREYLGLGKTTWKSVHASSEQGRICGPRCWYHSWKAESKDIRVWIKVFFSHGGLGLFVIGCCTSWMCIGNLCFLALKRGWHRVHFWFFVCGWWQCGWCSWRGSSACSCCTSSYAVSWTVVVLWQALQSTTINCICVCVSNCEYKLLVCVCVCGSYSQERACGASFLSFNRFHRLSLPTAGAVHHDLGSKDWFSQRLEGLFCLFYLKVCPLLLFWTCFLVTGQAWCSRFVKWQSQGVLGKNYLDVQSLTHHILLCHCVHVGYVMLCLCMWGCQRESKTLCLSCKRPTRRWSTCRAIPWWQLLISYLIAVNGLDFQQK